MSEVRVLLPKTNAPEKRRRPAGDDCEPTNDGSGGGSGSGSGRDREEDDDRGNHAAASATQTLQLMRSLSSTTTARVAPLPDFVDASISAAAVALDKQRRCKRGNHTVASSSTLVAQDDLQLAQEVQCWREKQAGLFSLNVTPTNIVEVAGELLQSIGVRIPPATPVSVETLKALQRQIVPFNFVALSAATTADGNPEPTTTLDQFDDFADTDVRAISPPSPLTAIPQISGVQHHRQQVHGRRHQQPSIGAAIDHDEDDDAISDSQSDSSPQNQWLDSQRRTAEGHENRTLALHRVHLGLARPVMQHGIGGRAGGGGGGGGGSDGSGGSGGSLHSLSAEAVPSAAPANELSMTDVRKWLRRATETERAGCRRKPTMKHAKKPTALYAVTVSSHLLDAFAESAVDDDDEDGNTDIVAQTSVSAFARVVFNALPRTTRVMNQHLMAQFGLHDLCAKMDGHGEGVGPGMGGYAGADISDHDYYDEDRSDDDIRVRVGRTDPTLARHNDGHDASEPNSSGLFHRRNKEDNNGDNGRDDNGTDDIDSNYHLLSDADMAGVCDDGEVDEQVERELRRAAGQLQTRPRRQFEYDVVSDFRGDGEGGSGAATTLPASLTQVRACMAFMSAGWLHPGKSAEHCLDAMRTDNAGTPENAQRAHLFRGGMVDSGAAKRCRDSKGGWVASCAVDTRILTGACNHSTSNQSHPLTPHKRTSPRHPRHTHIHTHTTTT